MSVLCHSCMALPNMEVNYTVVSDSCISMHTGVYVLVEYQCNDVGNISMQESVRSINVCSSHLRFALDTRRVTGASES